LPKKGEKTSEETKQKMRAASLGQVPWNKGKQHSEETKKKIKDSVRKANLSIDRTLSIETKEKIRNKALQSNHRRLLRSIRTYTKKDGTQVQLDSSWEEKLAVRLDELNISWIRPESIIWEDVEGKKHNYFPDFYLPDYDIYLDPKNSIAYKSQIEKIKILETILPNLLILTSIEQIEQYNPGSVSSPPSKRSLTM
jgi:hypothetical protein